VQRPKRASARTNDCAGEVRAMRSFSTNSRTRTGTGEPAPPSRRARTTPRRTKDALPQPSEGQIPVLPGFMEGPVPTGLVLGGLTTRPPSPPNAAFSLSTRRHAFPALHRVSTRRIPASPGLSLGPVPTGLVLVIELMLIGLTASPPPKPRPHTPDPVQHGPPTSLPLGATLTLAREKHKEQSCLTEPDRSRASRTTPVISGGPTSQLSSSLL
jgi:hypothetical protein